MLILFQVLNHLAVDSLVLQGAMQHNKHFGGNCPVVQVWDVSLQDEFEGTNWTHLVFVFSIQALEQVCNKPENMNQQIILQFLSIKYVAFVDTLISIFGLFAFELLITYK